MKKMLFNLILLIVLSFFIAILMVSISHYLIYHSFIAYIGYNLKNGVIEIIVITFGTLVGINHK